MDFKYLLKIFIIVFLILSIINFISSNGLNLKESTNPKKLTNVIIMEGLENKNPLTISSSKAFCETNKGAKQETSCNALTKYNCNLTSCCIWTSDNKCKAGNESGPIFGSDSKGKTIPLDYYYFQNKCYGPNCSKY
jgi:regulatory protein YycI of two-component signal transduction system YycFG